jgi:hypothetical protein
MSESLEAVGKHDSNAQYTKINTDFVKLAAHVGSSTGDPGPIKLFAYDVHLIKLPPILHVCLNIKPAEATSSINRNCVRISYLQGPIFILLDKSYP